MKKGYKINVLDKGFVRFVDRLGTEKRILEAARVSYLSKSKGTEQDKNLLHYLLSHKHTSPFEQCSITFNIRMPIFVMRQFVRHRTFRINEQSARYSKMKDDFYIPERWRTQDKKNKQGSVCDPQLVNPVIHTEIYCDSASSLLERYCRNAYDIYEVMVQNGIAREMARMVLPVNLYTEIYVNCDLHNLMHFLKLRLDSHAQWEMRQYAEAMYRIFKSLYPETARAFDKYIFDHKNGKMR